MSDHMSFVRRFYKNGLKRNLKQREDLVITI